jgi:hypothetical protein
MESGQTPEVGTNPLDFQERPVAAAPAPRASTSQNLLEQAAAVTRFGAELHRRMGEAGVDGVHGLFALAEQLNRALATVSHSEIERADADLERVAAQVRTMQDNLRQLKAVKADLEGLGGIAKL